MSFFPQAFLTSHPNQSQGGFTPLFRLLEDFDTYSRNSPSTNEHHHRQTPLKTFTPKFDVKEEERSYELHGELPGIEQKDVEIEFTDAQTLSVRGKIEREYHTSNDNSNANAAVEGTPLSGSIEPTPSETSAERSHHATVADETEDSTDGGAGTPTSAAADQTIQKATPASAPQQQKSPAARYWASERSYGSFARTFTFPERIDQDAVKASMKNGVLSVVVPKAPKYQSKKITVQ